MDAQDHKPRHHAYGYAREGSPIPPARRLGAACLAVLLSSGIAACGQDRVSAGKNPTKSTVLVPIQSKTPQTPIDASVGQSVKTEQGNVITVYQFQSPAAYAESGFVIAAADVGVCSSDTVVTEVNGVAVRAGISPSFFSVQLEDGTVQESQSPGTKDPALSDQLLQTGQCVRGWVTFHVPEQKKVAYVLFRSLSVIRWHTT